MLTQLSYQSHSSFNPSSSQSGLGSIQYHISPLSDPGEVFSVDEAGVVSLTGRLDHEAAPLHALHVLAVDEGVPPRTATATLTVGREASLSPLKNFLFESVLKFIFK